MYFWCRKFYMIRKFELSGCRGKCTGKGTIVAAMGSGLERETYCSGSGGKCTAVGTVAAE
jgi:hypothetical protein